jgi:hypothetical protein
LNYRPEISSHHRRHKRPSHSIDGNSIYIALNGCGVHTNADRTFRGHGN